MKITQQDKEEIISIIKTEVVPAIGCTEPIAVALAVAKAKETLGSLPKQINVRLSANVLKNAMGVGIPGTGMIGLPIAIALGAIGGKSEYQLEVLRDCTPETVEQGKKFIDEKRISIAQKKDTEQKLYIEINCHNGDDSVKVIIAGEHTHFALIQKNNEIILDNPVAGNAQVQNQHNVELTLRKVYDFAMETPIDELEFILESAEVNKKVAIASLHGEYGHSLGKTIFHQPVEQFFGNGIYSKILSYTAAACDARMAGAKIPVMCNSGSGNQGISATLPVLVYAEERLKSREQLIRALILSNLTVIYIKQHFGRLSALCGCVVAATGSSCGITYLMDGGYEQICYAVQNMVANITGMICDGAKPSCALKIATGASTAILSSMLAIENKSVSSVEGIIDQDVDKTIRNLTAIGTLGMNQTDKLVLDIMTQK